MTPSAALGAPSNASLRAPATAWPDASSAASASSSMPPGKWWYSDPLDTLPDTELDDYVDQLARRLASFDPQALAATKRLVRGRVSTPSVDEYRETLEALRALIVSPSTAARRAAVARHAAEVGADFELRMRHHLGLIEETIEAVS
jgi:hypothetical protein